MSRPYFLTLGLAVCLVAPVLAADPPVQPKMAHSRIVGVTVYPHNALVTREVEVPEGAGSVELVVNPLPPQTMDSSLYSEGTDNIRILTTRYRQRPILEDTREEVRKLQAQLKQLQRDMQKGQSECAVIEQNLKMLAKLEDFTGTTLKSLTEKGLLNSDSIISLSKYVMDSRGERAQALVALQQQQQDNQEQIQFVQRKLHELAAGSSKIERDAVIIVDKRDGGAGRIRLNYLVNSAAWKPQYKLRADKKENKPVNVEYLAAVTQHTGEDWNNVNINLSTAQPMLNATPPDLVVLDVVVVPRAAMTQNQMTATTGAFGLGKGEDAELNRKAKELRGQASQSYSAGKDGKSSADGTLNTAAALEQTSDLLSSAEEFKKQKDVNRGSRRGGEGPSITYTLVSKLSVPSRNDEQVVEITKLEMKPDFYYKAVPVLTNHVYRLADLTNSSNYVLLPGEATMYTGTDFVGRAELPLVAIGEQFTAGFGVDPQLQVQRQMTDKTRTTQGDNQVHRFEYRVLVSSYKTDPVKVQLWDRLPHAESESVGVTLLKSEPATSVDPLYLRENRPNNLLRWDLKIEPKMNGEKALVVNYEFKLELGRQMKIQSLSINPTDVGIPLPKEMEKR